MNYVPDKPYDEPHRDKGLEECPYCRHFFPLEQDRCWECTWERGPQNRVLAKKVLAWRRSPEGQRAYARLKSDREAQRKGYARFAAVVLAFVGFVVFGFIGLFFDSGLLFGLLGGGGVMIAYLSSLQD
jgi:hypothetical protein